MYIHCLSLVGCLTFVTLWRITVNFVIQCAHVSHSTTGDTLLNVHGHVNMLRTNCKLDWFINGPPWSADFDKPHWNSPVTVIEQFTSRLKSLQARHQLNE